MKHAASSLVQSVLVVNPFASRSPRSGSPRSSASSRASPSSTVVLTERPRPCDRARHRGVPTACGAAIVVFSGDGGFNEALNGLDADVPIGFLPGGGTSVLPRALGLPRDPVAAARQVAEAIEAGPDAPHHARPRERPAVRLQRGYRARRRRGAARRRAGPGRATASGPATSRSRCAVVRALARAAGRLRAAARDRGLGRAAFAFVANGSRRTPTRGRLPLPIAREATFELGSRPRRARRSVAAGSLPSVAARVLRGHAAAIAEFSTGTTSTGSRSAATRRSRCRPTARTSATSSRPSSRPSGRRCRCWFDERRRSRAALGGGGLGPERGVFQ